MSSVTGQLQLIVSLGLPSAKRQNCGANPMCRSTAWCARGFGISGVGWWLGSSLLDQEASWPWVTGPTRVDRSTRSFLGPEVGLREFGLAISLFGSFGLAAAVIKTV